MRYCDNYYYHYQCYYDYEHHVAAAARPRLELRAATRLAQNSLN